MEDDNDPPCGSIPFSGLGSDYYALSQQTEAGGEGNPRQNATLIFTLLRAEKIQGLSCQPVEGLHGQFQVVDLRVLGLVVAKPRE
jgi:hypothetical protein